MRNLQQISPPRTARPIDGDIDTLATMLRSIIDQGLRLNCALDTPGARQCCEFSPRKLDLDNRLLVLSGEGAVIQVILPVIAGLAADFSVSEGELHLIGVDGGSLLSIGPASAALDAGGWRNLLQAAFKSSC
ncbi:hypothetical protein [Geminisphaera colitermitum]|uniref:hypothetical protein n=1 Tax=Geminisphaera colitermitum TaxID=1148786 RepID=UPI0005B93267|nr:hypothetical protein [Geminisphaera colitermitum]